MNKEESYLDYQLYGSAENSGKDGSGYFVRAEKYDEYGDINRKFIEYTFISGTASSTRYAARFGPEIIKRIADLTFSKAKARIVLQLHEDGMKYEQILTSNNIKGDFKELPDFYIQKWILKALYNLRKSNPFSYKKQPLDVQGFCYIFSITENQFFLCADILMEKSLINTIISNGIREGLLFITATGIDYLGEIDKKTRMTNNNVQLVQNSREYKYDIAISFAGEDRNIAREIATSLSSQNIKVFFDEFEKEKLWGKNLYDHLSHVYTDAAKFCIILISENYSKKSWTNLERQNAQARAFRESREYILPVRIDKTKLPGLPETVGYLSLDETSINEIVEFVKLKLQSLS